MQGRSVLIAGSKRPDDYVADKCSLAEELGRIIGRKPGWYLINGGARGDTEGDWGAIDFHAAKGVIENLPSGLTPEEKILTIHPRGNRTDLHQMGRVISARGNTTEARRFELVNRADAVITIEGHQGTPKIIEYAIAANKVVLPVPCSGGASQEMWNEENYRQQLLNGLGLTSKSPEVEVLFEGLHTPQALARTVFSLIRKKLSPSCFIMMPFGTSHATRLYQDCLVPWLSDLGYEPTRADSVHGSRFILEDIITLIRNSELIIADVTGLNPNVMYELGYAHALGRQVIMIMMKEEGKSLKDQLSFDIQGMRIITFSGWEQVKFREELCQAVAPASFLKAK